MKVIAIAKAEVGYKEAGTNKTKYAADFDSKWPAFYNTKKQGAEWCDIFFDWLFCQAYGPEQAREMLYQPARSAGAGCKYSAGYYRAAGAFFKTPQVGDQIFFGTPGNESHTGIVVAVENDFVHTIEGNKNNAVRECKYALSDPSISGYGRPKYKEDKIMIEVPRLAKGSKGQAVKTIQILLHNRGFKGANGKYLSIDGDFGTNTEFAVKGFQKSVGITQDGIVGQLTWPTLLN